MYNEIQQKVGRVTVVAMVLRILYWYRKYVHENQLSACKRRTKGDNSRCHRTLTSIFAARRENALLQILSSQQMNK